ncbi:class II histone deacetylase [Nereida sp. MMG025]|uniref:class II histone deacetylase n=1 Tax=Nereida sp. MMG025 TaxID=2909981 RepID=UPI001F3D4E18|nr:class II histone deacetylase [Nereida sp. MMG025]MCF6444052.1 class II histone deacetylase [Nereida sp. MMG025]
MTQTAFFWDERCFWHSGGNYAFTLPVGDLVQPLAAGGLPESPETKRRLKNLMDATGLSGAVAMQSADAASPEDARRVHPQSYLTSFKDMSDAGGGELGLRTPFGKGGFEGALLSAGLASAAVSSVLTGKTRNAYALSRPPGHHCLADFPNGFCLMNNIAIAIEAARANGLAKRFAVLDWDVHHGNGTEAIYADDPDVLTVSIHQDRNYPLDTGAFTTAPTNLNIPLPPGAGHRVYLRAMAQLALPAIRAFEPDIIIVACGYDAAAIDPLSRMLASADTFRRMTRMTMDLADDICDGRIAMTHEGGYSEVYVPFCGHAVLGEMSGSKIHAPDPMATTIAARQPDDRFDAFVFGQLDEMAAARA